MIWWRRCFLSAARLRSRDGDGVRDSDKFFRRGVERVHGVVAEFLRNFCLSDDKPGHQRVDGIAEHAVRLPNGGSQSLVLALTPAAQIAPTEENFVFQCSGAAAAAADIIGVNTLLLSADAGQPADVIALAATPTQDGGAAPAGRESAQAFAVATVNLGVAALVTVTVDRGDITLPVSLAICQTNPAAGSLPCGTEHLSHRDDRRQHHPNLRFFVTAKSALPFFPSHVRAFVRLRTRLGTSEDPPVSP